MRTLVVLAASMLALVAAAAPRPSEQESTIQDDSLLVFGSPAEQSLALDMMKALGADRLRVSVYLVARRARRASPRQAEVRRHRPRRVPGRRVGPLRQPRAPRRGRGHRRQLRPRRPRAAVGDLQPAARRRRRRSPARTRRVRRVRPGGRRPLLRGLHAPGPGGAPPPPPRAGAPAAAGRRPPARAPRAPTPTPPRQPPGALPRVDYWSIWNEPNQSRLAGPAVRRRVRPRPRRACTAALVDAAWTRACGAPATAADMILDRRDRAQGLGRQTARPRSIEAAALPARPVLRRQGPACAAGRRRRRRGCPDAEQRAGLRGRAPGPVRDDRLGPPPVQLPARPEPEVARPRAGWRSPTCRGS